MAKKLTDDEAMEMAYKRLFGDLDSIESRSLFDENDVTPNDGVVKNAEPEDKGSGGVKITVEPLMAGAIESEKMSTGDDEDEEKDHMRGISDMSPLMAQLHRKK